MRIAHWGLITLLVLSLGTASAGPQTSTSSEQQQKDSLAAAARRSQEQKQKTDQAKPAKVWDNDNIPTTQSAVSVVGNTEAPPVTSDTPAQKTTSAAKAAGENKSAIQGDILALKKQVEGLRGALDLMQRKYTLDQQSYYGKTNYAADKAGAAALKDEKSQIDDKQQAITDAQKKIDDLQAKLDAANQSGSSAAK